MPLYLWQASYTASGIQGLKKDGGSKRAQMVRKMTEELGGKLHAFYYCFGESDIIGISEFPDHATELALSLAVNSSGAATLRSTVLITPEEIDKAVKIPVTYRAPGS
jgi:uncharacterized protein with GYD domain